VGEAEVQNKLEEKISEYRIKLAEHQYPKDVDEGAAMIEALIALWCFHPNGYSSFVDRFDVIATEQEMKLEVDFDEQTKIALNCRPDAVVRDKRTGLNYTIDFKTAAMGDKSIVSSSQFDFQSLTQPYAASKTLDIPIVGEIRWTFVKGKRMPQKDEHGQIEGWRADSYLLYPYAAMIGGELKLAFGGYWYCAEPHKWKVKGGMCPGHKPHKHNADWERVNLSQLGSPTVFEWVRDVCAMSADDGNYDDMLGLVRIGEPILLNEGRAERLVRQIVTTTIHCYDSSNVIRNLMAEDWTTDALNKVDVAFPQNLDNCVLPYRCTYFDLCHGSNNLGDLLITHPNVIEETNYKPRNPNHDESAVDFD